MLYQLLKNQAEQRTLHSEVCPSSDALCGALFGWGQAVSHDAPSGALKIREVSHGV